VASGEPTLYIWLGGEPDLTAADGQIEDVPGERDLDLLARAVREGIFGVILPVRISYAQRPDPEPGQWKSIDTARFLRDYSIRHRRRYEVLVDTDSDDGDDT